MYRQSWTAYPAARLTWTCPMPTRPPPLMDRTHEDHHSSPYSLSLTPPLWVTCQFFLSPPIFFFIIKMWEQRKMEEKKGLEWTHHHFSLSSKREEVISSPKPFQKLGSPSSSFFLPGCYAKAVDLLLLHAKTVCYMRPNRFWDHYRCIGWDAKQGGQLFAWKRGIHLNMVRVLLLFLL